MSDMRNYLGEGAHAGQELHFWTTGISLGKGKFTVVTQDEVTAESPEIQYTFFKGPVTVNVKVTGPGQCKIALWAGTTYHVDEKATYKDVGQSREIYCNFFPQLFAQVSVVLWRDGKYSNFKIWGKDKVFGVWGVILHAWAHPAKALEAAEAPAVLLNADLEPLRPSVQA
jgi:hypothetical protein